MAYADGKKSGGRKAGSKNKLTLALAQMRAEATKKINAELGEDAFKGDAIDFLQAIYKSPHFDPDMRMEAATRASQFERAKKTESMIEDKRSYVVRMPAPVADLDEWMRINMPDNTTPAPSITDWAKQYGEQPSDTNARGERLAEIAKEAAAKKATNGSV
jgi:hypothetical protein